MVREQGCLISSFLIGSKIFWVEYGVVEFGFCIGAERGVSVSSPLALLS